MSKGIFDKRFRNHIPTDTAVHTLLCTNELGYVEADASYRIIGTPQKSILFGYTTDGAGMLQYKSVKYPLKSGSLFCIDCSNPHSDGRIRAFGNFIGFMPSAMFRRPFSRALSGMFWFSRM